MGWELCPSLGSGPSVSGAARGAALSEALPWWGESLQLRQQLRACLGPTPKAWGAGGPDVALRLGRAVAVPHQ